VDYLEIDFHYPLKVLSNRLEAGTARGFNVETAGNARL
jgi:hypothetical protein